MPLNSSVPRLDSSSWLRSGEWRGLALHHVEGRLWCAANSLCFLCLCRVAMLDSFSTFPALAIGKEVSRPAADGSGERCRAGLSAVRAHP